MTAINDAELNALLNQAQAIYDAMAPEQKRAHDRAQAISWVYGNLKLDGSQITEEQVSAIWDKLYAMDESNR